MENSFENKENKRQGFIEEMRRFKAEEAEAGKTAHFEGVSEDDFKDFTVEDANYWSKIKDETITEEEWNRYAAGFLDEKGKPLGSVPQVRQELRAFFGNKVSVVFGLRRMALKKNQKSS